MSFSFGIYSERADPVYASGYGTGLAVGDGAYANVTFTEDTDSNATYDGTTWTCPSNQSGTYLVTVISNDLGRNAAIMYLTCSYSGVDDNTRQVLQYATNSVDSTGVVYQRVVNLVVGDTVVVRAYSGDASMTFTGSFQIRRL